GVARMAIGTRRLARALAGARLAGALAARAGVAVAAGAGGHALGHVPGAECGRVAVRQRLQRALLLALLERLLRLLGRHLAADGEAAVRLLAAAAAATVLAHVVEAAQFAALVGGVVAVDVGLPALAHVQRGLGRAALANHRLQGQGGGRVGVQAQLAAQGVDLLLRQFLRLPAQQLARQADVAVAHALEAADLAALRFPQAAHFAVAAFLDHDLEPVVRVGAADALDLVELGRAVLQGHAAGEAVDHVVRHALLAFRCAHAHHVLALDLVRGMHHRVGDLAVGGQQQQAGGVDVQAADRDPARALEPRQRLEDGRAALGILAGGHFAFGLVVDQHARRLGQGRGHEGLAVEFDAVAAADALADLRDLAVDLHQAVGDALLQRAARAEAGLGQHLVQALLDLRGRGGVLAALERELAEGLAWGCFSHGYCSGLRYRPGPGLRDRRPYRRPPASGGCPGRRHRPRLHRLPPGRWRRPGPRRGSRPRPAAAPRRRRRRWRRRRPRPGLRPDPAAVPVPARRCPSVRTMAAVRPAA